MFRHRTSESSERIPMSSTMPAMAAASTSTRTSPTIQYTPPSTPSFIGSRDPTPLPTTTRDANRPVFSFEGANSLSTTTRATNTPVFSFKGANSLSTTTRATNTPVFSFKGANSLSTTTRATNTPVFSFEGANSRSTTTRATNTPVFRFEGPNPLPTTTTSTNTQLLFGSRPSLPTTTRVADAPLAFGSRNPDSPLPSIEKATDTISVDSDENSASPVYTPSSSSGAGTLRQSSEHNSLNQVLQNWQINSVSPRAQAFDSTPSSTPSSRVTETSPRTNSRPGTATRSVGGIVDGFHGLRMNSESRNTRFLSPNHRQANSSTSEHLGADRSSPGPSRRRRSRSGSTLDRSPYKVEDEKLPNEQFYRREVQEALNNARNVTAKLAQVLSDSRLQQEQGSSIQKLYEEATTLSKFQPPAYRIVGFVGESGVGKSSLINSLLDKKGFSRASNSGEACTCVATEYHFHERDDYVIKIDFFTVQELRSQFERLLTGYREYKSSKRSDLSTKDFEELERKANLAIYTFKASSRNKINNVSEILNTMPYEQAIRTFMEILPELNAQGRNVEESFNDSDRCSSRLKILTSDMADGNQTCLWPFIRKLRLAQQVHSLAIECRYLMREYLRVYMRAHILSRGLVLADLPGLRDLNSARQNVTETYIRQCHQIFVVARIGRATTDQGVKEAFELARRASLSNIGVVCTQSENIKSDEAKHDNPAEEKKITEMEDEIADQKTSIASLEEAILEYNDLLIEEFSAEDTQDLLKCQQQLEKEKNLLDELEFRLTRRMVSNRNEEVRRKLQNEYKSTSKARKPHVSCISNTMYSENRDKPAQKAIPLLELSGIIELRHYCIGLVAESHLRASVEFVNHKIPALLGSVELWIQAGSGNINAEKKQRILDTVSVIQRVLDGLTSPMSETNDITTEIMKKFDDHITSNMRRRVQPWTESAQTVSAKWERELHHSSYAAFCRKYGTHAVKDQPARYWNEEAMAAMTKKMSEIWAEFDDDMSAYLHNIHQSIDEAFRSCLRPIASIDMDLQVLLKSVISTMRHRKILLLNSIEAATGDFHEKMFYARTNALSGVRTSIIGKLLESTYDMANGEYGGGSFNRKKEIISSGFGSQNLFNNHRRNFRQQFLKISGELQETTTVTVTEHLSVIKADLDTLRNQNVILDSEKNPEFRKRLEREVVRVRGEMEKIRRPFMELLNASVNDMTVEDEV